MVHALFVLGVTGVTAELHVRYFRAASLSELVWIMRCAASGTRSPQPATNCTWAAASSDASESMIKHRLFDPPIRAAAIVRACG